MESTPSLLVGQWTFTTWIIILRKKERWLWGGGRWAKMGVIQNLRSQQTWTLGKFESSTKVCPSEEVRGCSHQGALAAFSHLLISGYPSFLPVSHKSRESTFARDIWQQHVLRPAASPCFRRGQYWTVLNWVTLLLGDEEHPFSAAFISCPPVSMCYLPNSHCVKLKDHQHAARHISQHTMHSNRRRMTWALFRGTVLQNWLFGETWWEV